MIGEGIAALSHLQGSSNQRSRCDSQAFFATEPFKFLRVSVQLNVISFSLVDPQLFPHTCIDQAMPCKMGASEVVLMDSDEKCLSIHCSLRDISCEATLGKNMLLPRIEELFSPLLFALLCPPPGHL